VARNRARGIGRQIGIKQDPSAETRSAAFCATHWCSPAPKERSECVVFRWPSSCRDSAAGSGRSHPTVTASWSCFC